MTRPKQFSEYPDARRAFDKLLIEGPYTIAFDSPSEAVAFRHRCHRFRRKFTEQCDELNLDNIYAMTLIRLDGAHLSFEMRPDPVADFEYKPYEPQSDFSTIEDLLDGLGLDDEDLI